MAQLALLLAERGDETGLIRRADGGDRDAAAQLACCSPSAATKPGWPTVPISETRTL
ncbi:MAG: hypothetical protein AVDCRST_MAG66-3235 [uncultured Pseudonocardia sp.]|uniref:Uncharacterized protein n=1 Tax=uncultured Pseudonocardia sp. TaxID=211455 RepID=A0A6J4PYR0_9PSEU|nr:MAG: hypothetical protein AVDCRST_MAG66-3235 [uncultured Pseudonocardia sp.]